MNRIGHPTDNCTAAVNIRGEHVACDEGKDHIGWAHANREHEMIWLGEGDERRWTPDWAAAEKATR